MQLMQRLREIQSPQIVSFKPQSSHSRRDHALQINQMTTQAYRSTGEVLILLHLPRLRRQLSTEFFSTTLERQLLQRQLLTLFEWASSKPQPTLRQPPQTRLPMWAMFLAGLAKESKPCLATPVKLPSN
jgi:hypothetical protein